MNKNIQILSIEGKDVLTKNYCVSKDSLFKASLDDSIEVDELKTLGKKIIKTNKKTNRLYTTDIITITFKYACKGNKEFDSDEKSRIESLQVTLKLLKQELKIASKSKNINLVNSLKEEISRTKQILNNAKDIISKREIRNQLYQYGFNIWIDGKMKHFVRYKRSSGSARVGKCLFINEKYAKHMIDWSFAGISHKKDEHMDCASMESYISLPTSSCVNNDHSRFKLKPENILLIEDGTSTFKDTVMATRLINEEYDEDGNVIGGDLDTNVEETEITNKIWDGESLLDKSVFEEYGYEDKAILQMRKRMFKGIGVNTDIQQFFKDNGITEISQLNGKTIATNISQIKLITTPSSVKYLKYGTFEEWLEQIRDDGDWGICKYEKPQKHFNGMVQTHYQLLNTLGMDKETMHEFLQDSIDYVNLLKTDTAVFKYHLGLKEEYETDELSENISSNSDFVLSVLNINDDFINTKMCKKFRSDIVHSYIKNIRKGHVLVDGNYSVVVGSPYEMLLHSIGKWNGKSSIIKPHECVSSKFKVGDDILGVRSPQPTMCNMTVFKNNEYEILNRYFNMKSEAVIYISAIGWNVFECESSMDLDGDAMMITNNKHIVDAAKKLNEKIIVNGREINRFLVSTDFTPKSSIKRRYGWEDLSDTDIKCSSNKIGEIINMAQMLNSVYWDKKYNGSSEEELFDLYKDICQLNILSCIEIDRCKKLSPVDARKELDKIRAKGYLPTGEISRNKQKKTVGVRPYFFKFLDGGKDYKFQKFHTGMDYLEQILDKEVKYKETYDKCIPLKDILVKSNNKKANRHSIEKIKREIKTMRTNIYKIWNDCQMDNVIKKDMVVAEKNKCYDNIKNININHDIIATIIKRIGKSYECQKYEEYKSIGMTMLRTIFNINKIDFIKCFLVKKKNNVYIIEDKNSNDIILFGIKFKKKY